MFVILTIQDKIKLHPKLDSSMLDELNKKYAGKFIENEGIAILVNKIIKTITSQIIDGYIICECIFEVTVHKYYINEIVEGRICKQDDEGIEIATYNTKIYIHNTDFMEGCNKIYVKYNDSNYVNWVWNYEDDKYYFTNNEQVRVKIKKVNYENNEILGSFDCVGLGPVSWWM